MSTAAGGHARGADVAVRARPGAAGGRGADIFFWAVHTEPVLPVAGCIARVCGQHAAGTQFTALNLNCFLILYVCFQLRETFEKEVVCVPFNLFSMTTHRLEMFEHFQIRWLE